MKTIYQTLITTVFIGLMLNSTLFAKEIKKEYSGQKEVKVKLVLGSCTILDSKDSKIYVNLEYTYDDENYTPVFNVTKKKLYLKETFQGSKSDDGDSKWTIKVPVGMEVDFESATGDLTVKNVSDINLDGSSGTGFVSVSNANGEFDLNSGTGDVDVLNSSGEFDLNSGTGDVQIKNSKGSFDANSGTGDVYGFEITIEDDAEFNSGTGEAEVKAPMGTDYDLSLNSGTDDAILDMNGLPIEGYFEFTAQNRRGSIVSPVKFDREEMFENGDQDKIRKSFTKGKSSSRYFISTGTGKAKLKK